MNSITKEIAKKCGILDKLTALEQDLLKVDGVLYDNFYNGVDICIDNYRDFAYVIVVPEYDYHKGFTKTAKEILKVAQKYGLKRTEDTIEDYGAHMYIVLEGWKEK